MAEIEEKMVDTSTTDNLEDAYADAMPEEVPSAEDGGHLVPGDEGEHDAELHEQILTQETMWSGKIFDVERMEVKLPNGRCSVRDVVRHCGAVAIVALTENGKIALVRQYRTALDRVTVEIPAGKMDPGEEPLDCAKRELKEETGLDVQVTGIVGGAHRLPHHHRHLGWIYRRAHSYLPCHPAFV